MKRYHIGLLTLFLFGIIFWWLFFRSPPKNALPKHEAAKVKKQPTPIASSQTIQSAAETWTNPDGSYKPWTGGMFSEKSDPNHSDLRWLEVRRRNETDKDWQWKMPINFYGKVIDENGNPVEGAEIEFGWTSLDPKTGHSEATTQSNFNGMFSLVGAQGKRLRVDVKKEGYYTSHEGRRPSFEYADFGEDIFHEADPNNPVIFHLRKKQEAESMVKRYSPISLPRNGNIARFDFESGKISNQGQIELQAWCSEKDAEGKYDWRLIIRVPNGGIKSTKEEFAFLAPETGYAPELVINMPKNLGKDWQSSIEQQAYVVFGNPAQYARLNFRMTGLGENFYMDYWLNPSGSRNLEFDESKKINK